MIASTTDASKFPAVPTMNTVLDPQRIINTISQLKDRIGERFPDSSLSQVCFSLEEIALNAKTRAEWIGRPLLWLRSLVVLGCGLFLATALGITYLVFQPLLDGLFFGKQPWADDGALRNILSNVETEINFMILIGGATIFLWTIENRYKRWRALQAIHELRAVAHIIDMHQLTKDPDRILASKGDDTESSPEFKMTSYELRRYLDYCSEMLSLTGKVAALYVQKFDDPVALAAASEVESTSTGLSRKVWQKLMILHNAENRPPTVNVDASEV